MTQTPFPPALQLTLLVVQVSILYYGGHLVISGQMTSGNLISFIIYEFVLGDCMEVRGRQGEGGPGEKGGVRERNLKRVLLGSREVVLLSQVGGGQNVIIPIMRLIHLSDSNSVYGAKWWEQRLF